MKPEWAHAPPAAPGSSSWSSRTARAYDTDVSEQHHKAALSDEDPRQPTASTFTPGMKEGHVDSHEFAN